MDDDFIGRVPEAKLASGLASPAEPPSKSNLKAAELAGAPNESAATGQTQFAPPPRTRARSSRRVSGYLQCAPQDMGEHFAHRLRWAHAVNSRVRLVRALTSDVHFIEADVSCGPLRRPTNQSSEEGFEDVETCVRVPDGQAVIMAHYPTERSSDLSLENFISIVLHYNDEAERQDVGPEMSHHRSCGSSSSHRRRRAKDDLHLINEQAFLPSPPAAKVNGIDLADISTEDEATAFAAELDAVLEEESRQPLLPSCVGSRKGNYRKVERKRRLDARKGIKLDFKLWSCVEPTIDYLRKVEAAQKLGGHLWLNADVFAGPGALMSPLDAQKFVRICAERIPEAVLSLGWGSTILSTTRLYTHEMIDRMIELCMYPIVQPSLPDPVAATDSANVGDGSPEEAAAAADAPSDSGSCRGLAEAEGMVVAPAAACLHITFAVAAEYVLASADNLRRLLNTVPSASLTIYSGVGSLGVTPANAQDFLRAFGKGQCFFDLKVTKAWRSYFFGQTSRCCVGPKALPPSPGSDSAVPQLGVRSTCGPPLEALPLNDSKIPQVQSSPGLITIV